MQQFALYMGVYKIFLHFEKYPHNKQPFSTSILNKQGLSVDSPCLSLYLCLTRCIYICIRSRLLPFIIKQTMAVSFKIRISHLLSEFLANTLGILAHLKSARTISTFGCKPFTNGCYNFRIRIEGNLWFHVCSPLAWNILS